MNKRKILNVRLMFVALLGLISGILFFYLVMESIFLQKFNLFLIPISVIIIINITCLFLKLFKLDNDFIVKINKHFCASICFVISLAVGVGSMALRIVPILRLQDYVNKVSVTCVVDEITSIKGYLRIGLDDVKVDGKNLAQDVQLTTYYYSDSEELSIKVGDKLQFESSVRLTPLFDSASNIVSYLYGNAYRVQLDYEDIVISEGKADARHVIKQHVFNQLSDVMNSDNAGIAYGMLFGGKEYLNNEISDMFSYAGVAHILAVSGLHVGLVVALITWILRKTKVNKWVGLVINFIFLFFYCWLCNFTPSVTRASVMSLVLLLANASGREYDPLSSLCLAGCLILALNPLNLMSVGFQLSFLCVLSIITLSSKIERLLTKLKLNNFIAKTLAISFCINLVILPVCANSFEKVSMIGVVANVLVLPLFSVAFPVLFIATIISSIMPFMNFLLFIPNIFLHATKLVANFFASIPFAVFRFYNISYLVLLCGILIILAIKYLMVKPWIKGVVCGVLSVALITCFSINMVSNNYNNKIVLSYQYNSNNAIICVNNQNYLLGIQNTYMSNMLKSLKIRNIECIIAYDFESNKSDYLIQLCNEYNVKSVILPNNIKEHTLQYLGDSVNIITTDNFSLGNFDGAFMYNAFSDCIAFNMVGDKSILFTNPNNSNADNINAINQLNNIDYLIANGLRINVEMLSDVGTVIQYNQQENMANSVNLFDVSKYCVNLEG